MEKPRLTKSREVLGACTQHGWGVQTQGPSHPSLSEAAQSLDLQGSLSDGYSGLTCHPLKQLGKLPRPQAPPLGSLRRGG